MPITTATVAREHLPIVVGVEGSATGLAAARWAAAEAALRHLPLHLVHAGAPPPRPPVAGQPSEAAAILAAAADAARTEAPHVPVTPHLVTGAAEQALVRFSAHASLVVVGHRGHGTGSALRELRSPVASHVAAHAGCPVAVVHDPLRPAGPDTGPIVVGVDGSTAAGVALSFAFAEAALRHRALRVVRAWPPQATPGGCPPEEEGAPADLDEVEQRLYDWVRPWWDRYPQLPVSFTVVSAHPMCALAEASGHASLLVVGVRGCGEPAGPLGSVSQQLVHLATCPVAVIRTGTRWAQPAPRRASAGRISV